MNGCYSLFSVAMMTAACASASRQTATGAVDSIGPARAAPSTAEASKPVEVRSLVLDDPDEQTIRELRQAMGLFETFIAKADGDPKFKEAVQRSRDRVDDIQKEIEFITEGMKARR